ncbi:MAG TPA: hypothetical protein VKB45_04170 [Gemmatimonadales bacterium]|nr:hypothetical protein [Gemmatimonadales bacterium]
MRPLDPSLPPAVLLGGGANALSVARSLRRRGIRVVAPGGPDALRHSRCAQWLPLSGAGDVVERWRDWLTGAAGRSFAGAALMPCGDNGLELVLRYRAQLVDDFRVYEANDAVLAAMLDKAATYELARKVGVAAPQVWLTESREDWARMLQQVRYPCGLKPRLSHRFAKFAEEKMFVAHDAAELEAAHRNVESYGVPMLVTELIPGGEADYCSYYTYLDDDGEPLFHFTKRKLRQYPVGFGTGTYHVTDSNAEVAGLGLRFFQAIGLRGLACIEFKRDARDGKLKLIEVNHRFTEPNELLAVAGLDLASLVYNRLMRLPLPSLSRYQSGLTLAKPWEDFLAFRELQRDGAITWRAWIASRLQPACSLYFKWWDPGPFVARSAGRIRAAFKRASGDNPMTTRRRLVTAS